MDDADEIRGLVGTVGSAELVTVGEQGFPIATLLPVVWDNDERLIFHMARANRHWTSIEPDSPALAIVTGPQAYISPDWYPSKAEHGRAVPTWNYSSVHFTGRLKVHQDADWLYEAVRRLTDLHEEHRKQPWRLEDAPEGFIRQMLGGIVGIELVIERVEAKAKLSQNRSSEDRAGVIEGLRREAGSPGHEIAQQMAAQPDSRSAGI